MTQTTVDVTQTCADNYHTDRIINFGGKDQIYADCLTQGDVIEHLGQTLEVYSEPKYTRAGIVFEVLPLDSDAQPYEMRFNPDWRFDYVTYHLPSKEVAYSTTPSKLRL
ncbi:MAG: hypothetical protein QNJ37_04780 [Crocosphaera sp.]|nr:hypothetical protein [Crocosphaera sp.]